MPSATGARLAELQTRVHEWRSDRDAAQVVFMQCNGAVERLQRSIEAATARLAKKRLLLAQHMPPPPPPQADHAGDAANASFTSPSTRHHGDAPLRREAAVQCDAGLCRAADLASRLDAAHRENLLALRGLRRPLIDAAVRRNLALAADVAGLVGRNRVMETELWLQVERFRAERMPPHQIEAAEQLVVSVLGAASGAGAGAGAGLDDTDEHCIDVSGVEPADRFDATELVYRTVEKARLALSRSLVPIRYNH